MPAKSKAQYKFFKMLEHNPELAKKHNLTYEQIKEFTKNNKNRQRFSKLIEKIK